VFIADGRYLIVGHMIATYHLPCANRCDHFSTSVLCVINLIELEAVLVEVIQANELVVYVFICSPFLVSWCGLKSVKPGFYVSEETVQNACKIKEMKTYVYVEIAGTK